MTEENHMQNIPTMPIGKVMTTLASLYAGAITGGVPLKKLPTPFLWGPSGVGKSDGVRLLAGMIEKMTGKTVIVTDLRLLLYAPTDLHGIPVADSEKRFAVWLCPQVFAMDADENVVNLLFLDELSAALPSVQAAAYQLCLDRRVGEHALPDNCIVIAAGNRMQDQSVAYKMPKALCNRLMHFEIVPEFESWRRWAAGNGIDERVIAYLSFDNSRLCREPEAGETAYPTLRSWEFVSTILRTTGADPTACRSLVAATVGMDTALAFEQFCRRASSERMPTVDEICRGGRVPRPRSQDVTYVLLMSLTAAMHERAESITVDELDNVCAYVGGFAPDFAYSFFKDIHVIEPLKKKLMRCPSLTSWYAKNKHALA